MEEKGFVLMDVVIASAIIIIVLIMLTKGYGDIINVTTRNSAYNESLYVAQQTLEKLKAIDGELETMNESTLEEYLGEKQGNFYLVKMQDDETNNSKTYQVKVTLVNMTTISNKLVACHVKVMPIKKDQKQMELIGYYYLKKGGSADG